MVRFVIGIIILLGFGMIYLASFFESRSSGDTLALSIIIIALFIPGYLFVCFGWHAHGEKKRRKRWNAGR